MRLLITVLALIAALTIGSAMAQTTSDSQSLSGKIDLGAIQQSSGPMYLGSESYRESMNLSNYYPPPIVLFALHNWTTDGMNYSQHIPSLQEFLRPDWTPVRINYSLYGPGLDEFLSPNWTPQKINYSQHTPAFEEFMSPDYKPSEPSSLDYPAWMLEFLN